MLIGLFGGCGGGGGGSNPASSPDKFSVTFAQPAVSTTLIAGRSDSVLVQATMSYQGTEPVYLRLGESQGLVKDGSMDVSGDLLSATLLLGDAIAPGQYDSTLDLYACWDEDCKQQLAGSPFHLPLHVEVKPNLQIATAQPMRRTGRDPAPSQSLPLSLVPEAGELALRQSGAYGAFELSLHDGLLDVRTLQMPAGSYQMHAEVYGTSDDRYSASVDLSYVVEAPAGGELPLRLAPEFLNVTIKAQTQPVYRFKLQRPTWTDLVGPLQVSGDAHITNLHLVSEDEYEFTVDGTQLEAGFTYYATIAADAGPLGGQDQLEISVQVSPALLLENPEFGGLRINAQTQPANLRLQSQIATPEGSSVGWHVSSDQPWLKVLRADGITGVDPLQVEVDPSKFPATGWQVEAGLSVQLDQAGVSAVRVPVTVQNFLPRFDQASPGVLTGSSARVYLDGMVLSDSGVLGAGVLSVQGATLSNAQRLSDTRFAGDVSVIALDIDGVVAGRDVVIQATSPLGVTQRVLKAVAPPQVPSGHLALPFGSYRPASYLPGLTALTFTGGGALWRWPHDTAWRSAKKQALAQLLDAVPSPDEAAIYAVGAHAVTALDPATLAVLRQSSLSTEWGHDVFDSATVPGSSGLAYAADGRALTAASDDTWPTRHGVSWLAGCPSNDFGRTDLASHSCLGDPGSDYLGNVGESSSGASIARSAQGGSLALSYPNGRITLYKGLDKARLEAGSLAAGRRVVAVADQVGWTISDDGVIRMAPWSNAGSGFALAALLPSMHVAGGYGISGNGQAALIYSYRVADTADGARATEPTLSVVAIGTQTVVSRLALPAAVGCTAALAAGESCQHGASITVAPGDRSVFVVGPRGVVAMSLPDEVMNSLATRSRAASARKAQGMVTPALQVMPLH
ncbi:hypothetical protein GCM10009107_13290 [Ideonella azotifigens]|uniref:BACON domain-containing protein n=1 Tax=Ideonella azotifigens TaxID=513160 RepID=A0ABP3V3Y4_9BURK